MAEKIYYLYHLRDPETSAGFGFDGYVGISDDHRRRYREHMRAAAAGRHPNRKVQALYDKSGGNLRMRVVRTGTEEQVLASEGLVINRPNKHANIQAGGGRLRGLGQDELIKRAGIGATRRDSPTWQPSRSQVSPQQMALIAAASIAIAAGAYYGYRYYRKRKQAKGQDRARMPAADRPGTAAHDEARQAEAAARVAKARKMQHLSQYTSIALLSYLGLALAPQAPSE